jgi:MYXO-CTERM domain-containing protein
MNANYDRGDISFRTLSDDDNAGMCTIYPPGLDLDGCRGAQPRYGFSRYCGSDAQVAQGCTLSGAVGAHTHEGTAAFTLLGLGAALGLARRRAQSRRDRKS